MFWLASLTYLAMIPLSLFMVVMYRLGACGLNLWKKDERPFLIFLSFLWPYLWLIIGGTYVAKGIGALMDEYFREIDKENEKHR